MRVEFRQVGILGVGLLGGSIGLALKAAGLPARVVGYGHRRSTLDRAVESGAIDEGSDDLPKAVSGADLVILATPVGLFDAMLQQMAPALKPGAIVTDVGSTKRSVVASAARHLPKGVHFVGSHPMAGSEKRGVEFARADLFAGATCILTPTPPTPSKALSGIDQFWKSIGMRTVRLSPDEHDALLSNVSHLPHALAAALVLMQPDAALPLAGKGFLDTTRIAGGDGALWRDIFLDNADNVRSSLARMQQRLAELVALLDAKDGESLANWLDAAAARRDALLKQKLREMTPD